MIDPIPVRKELRDLSPEEMFLFFEGLAKFQQVDMEDPVSYYQIAGKSPMVFPLKAFGPKILMNTKNKANI